MTKKRQHYLLMLGIILVATNLRAPITSVGPVVNQISSELNLNGTLTGLVSTTPLVSFAVFSMLAPKIERRFGIERVLFVALLFLTVGIVIRSLGSTFSLFFGTVFIGIGIAHGNVLLPSMVKRYFPDKLGMMTGAYSVAMTTFGALASGISLPVSKIGGMGWQGALAIWVVLSLVTACVWFPQVRTKTTVDLSISKEESTKLMHSSLAWAISLFMGIQSLVFYTLAAWLPAILSDKGIKAESAGLILTVLQLFIIPATFFVPVLTTKVKKQYLLVIIGVGSIIAGVIGIIVSDSVVINYIAAALIGNGGGFCFSLSMMFFSLRTSSPHQASELSGMAQAIGYLLAACGPLMFGMLHDLTNSWLSPLFILLALSVILLGVGLKSSQNKQL